MCTSSNGNGTKLKARRTANSAQIQCQRCLILTNTQIFTKAVAFHAALAISCDPHVSQGLWDPSHELSLNVQQAKISFEVFWALAIMDTVANLHLTLQKRYTKVFTIVYPLVN